MVVVIVAAVRRVRARGDVIVNRVIVKDEKK